MVALTADTVREFWTEKRQEMTLLMAEWAADDKLCNLAYDLSAVPKNDLDRHLNVSPPSPKTKLDRFVDLVTGKTRTHVDPLDEHGTNKDAAMMVERGLEAWMSQQAESAYLRGEESPARAYARIGALRGCAFLRVLYDVDAIPPKPKGKKEIAKWERDKDDALFLLLQVRDPAAMCWEFSGNRLSMVVEEYKVGWRELEQYGVEQPEKGGKVKFTQAWTADSVLYMADDEPLPGYPKVNPYGEIPYVMAYAGFGLGTEVNPEGEGGLERRIWGLLRGSRGMFELFAQLWTQLNIIMTESAWPETELENAEAWEQRPDLKVEAGTGEPTLIPAGAGLRRTRPLLPTNDLMSFMAAIAHEIELDTGPDLLGGFQSPGVRTARQTEILATFARQKLGPFTEAMNAAFSRACHMALVIIADVIDKPVSFNGSVGKTHNRYTIDPAKIRGHWWPQVSFMPSLPVDKAANMALWGPLEPYVGPERMLEEGAGIEDAKDALKEGRKAQIKAALLAAVLANPQIHQAASAQLLPPAPEPVPEPVAANPLAGLVGPTGMPLGAPR